MLFIHWFYKVVRDKCCFSIGFTRLSATNVVFPLVLQGLSARNGVFHWFYKENSRTTRGQPTRHGFATGAGGATKLPHNRPSFTIESPLARPHSFASPRPLARTNETKRFPGWRFHKGLTPPTSNHKCHQTETKGPRGPRLRPLRGVTIVL